MVKIITFIVTAMMFSLGCQKSLNLGEKHYVGATRIGDGVQIGIKKDQITLNFNGKMDGSSIKGTLKPLSKSEKNLAFQLKDKKDFNVVISPEDLVIYNDPREYSKFGVGLSRQKTAVQMGNFSDVYNFVVQYHSQNKNRFSFGTIDLNANHTWRTWRFGDSPLKNKEPIVQGTWVENTKGEIQAFSNDKLFATITVSDDYDILLINFLAINGLAFGVKKNVLLPEKTDGNYIGLGSNGTGVKRLSIRDQVLRLGDKKFNLVYNQPWDGFFKDNKGEFVGLLSTKGTFFGLRIGAHTGDTQSVFAAVRGQ